MASIKITLSERAIEIRKLGQRVDEAHVAWLDAEADVRAPEGKAEELEREYQRLDAQYEEVAREVWAKPVRDWNDVVERAELAYALADDNPQADADLKLRGHMGPQAVAQLIMAVISLTGGPAWDRSDVSSDASRVEALERGLSQ